MLTQLIRQFEKLTGLDGISQRERADGREQQSASRSSGTGKSSAAPAPLPPSSSTLSPSMRSECAARLWNVLRDSTLNGWHGEILSELQPHHFAFIASDWQSWARHDQLPPQPEDPAEPWRVWIILGGRGAGKTRAGAEWVRAMALGEPPYADEPATRIALIGETLNDVRRG